jgi:hypothetical protein
MLCLRGLLGGGFGGMRRGVNGREKGGDGLQVVEAKREMMDVPEDASNFKGSGETLNWLLMTDH